MGTKYLRVVRFLLFAALEFGFAQGPPVYTDTPVFLGLEGRGVRTFVRFTSKKNTTAFSLPVIFPYNISTDFVVGAGLPLVHMSPENSASRTGAGDLSVFAKYLIFQKNGKAKTFRVALKFRETFPTGDTGKTPALGSGVYQSYGGLIAGYITTSIGLYGEAGYGGANRGLPDRLMFNLAVGYPLLPVTYPPKQLNLYLELNGSSATDNGASTIFLSPAIQLIPSRKFLLESGVQIPVKTSGATSDVRAIFTFGTRVLLF